ncbi:TBCD [Cervus elaphus hippelaphus]|uniref:TBCD n=1 Tax=Cervus elaphus hippelaphus TaxID=46360 RepID=A0A212D8T7_CEREH|nr:TBCD [Cervus elaphus hippelaphus]
MKIPEQKAWPQETGRLCSASAGEDTDAELPVVRAQRNRLCDLLGVPRPQLVPKVSPAPQATWGPRGPFLVRPPDMAPTPGGSTAGLWDGGRAEAHPLLSHLPPTPPDEPTPCLS